MNTSELRETKFEFKENPPKHEFRGMYSFNLSVDNCRITDIRLLYAIIKSQLKIETEIIETANKDGSGVHPLQFGVKEFLENILTEMNKTKDIDDIGYYVIKTRK